MNGESGLTGSELFLISCEPDLHRLFQHLRLTVLDSGLTARATQPYDYDIECARDERDDER